ncbi:hypothetical protein [Niabella ginsengisoli]|uniref:Uncharacterized protein n=1 Tax=Niabella ginsengisoli TaxID=522298 RepID=A0ABS9SKC8_9BACT|nr:hypothetical protein [Niabella ginsengisoli]MCH5598831.1 hypothetical protein [Niabella ginsengisoli]
MVGWNFHNDSKNAPFFNPLPEKLEQVALAALKNRKPSKLSWGIGNGDFARNRRAMDGAADHDMPLLKVTDASGKLSAVFLNYACHAVAMGAATNQIPSDWAGEALKLIEEDHPGVTALVAVGCGADANPFREENTRTLSALEFTILCGQKIADETRRMLATTLTPVNDIPVCKTKK